MFFSIKFKILLSITVIMTAAAGVNIYFTQRDVGNAMLVSQREAAEKMLDYVRLNTQGEYRKLLRAKTDMTLEKRSQLKEAALVSLSVLRSHDTVQGVSARAEAWIATIPFKKIHCLLLNREAGVIASSDPTFQVRTFQSLTDVKGRDLGKVMCHDRLSARGDYAVINMGKRRSLAYFVPFSPWRCTLVTILDIDDIQAEAEKKLNDIIKALNTTSKELVMIKGGYSFMFTGKKEFIISPPEAVVQNLANGINQVTGKPILDDMMAAATSDDAKFVYVSSLDPGKEAMTTSVSYFKALDWYIGVTVPVREIQRPARELVFRQSWVIAVILALGLVGAGFMVARIASPLRVLAAYAKKLPEQDFTAGAAEAAEIPMAELLPQSRDEVGELARSFDFMQSELKKNIRNLVDITAARERIQSELSVAREIQMGIIPKTFPTFPEHSEFELFATIEPAKEVGGDLYDFFLLDKDHVCFTLGDVSDKGVPAALFMVITRTLIKTTAEHELSPAKIMSHINNILAEDNPRAMFVTLVIGVLNIRTGALTYASGGHNPPIGVPSKGECSYQRGKSGPMVGVIEDIDYKELSVELLPGDSFFLYTDGVTEAMDPDQKLFSDERLLTVVNEGPRDGLEGVIDNVMAEVKRHAATAPQSDDIAMLMIRYNG